MSGNYIKVRNVVSPRVYSGNNSRPDFNARANSFSESLREQVKTLELDVELSIKAAPKPKKPKPIKKPRQKLGKNIWSTGGILIDKKRRGNLGMQFKPYVTAAELSSRSTKPNIGWVNKPIAMQKGEAERYLAKLKFNNGKPQINIKHRDVNADPRTGGMSVKSLGQTLDQIQPMAGVGVRAAARSGVVVDSAGRFRCPPGVPAANQFTDKTGSNCFDITPQNKRRLIREAISKAAEFLSKIHIINTVEERVSKPGFRSTRDNEISRMDLPTDQKENLLQIASKRDNLLAEVKRIEESAIEQIRKTYPEFTELTRSQDGLRFVNDPLKVLESALIALSDANPNLDLNGILWTREDVGKPGTKAATLEEQIRDHVRSVAEHIWDQLYRDVEIGPDGNQRFKELTAAQERRRQYMVSYVTNFAENTGSTFVGEYEPFARAMSGYLAKEQGFLYGMLDMANNRPNLYSKFTAIEAISPSSDEFDGTEARAWMDETGGLIMFWNPMLLVRQSRGWQRPLIQDGQYRIFEPAEDSVDAMESAILDEIANAATADQEHLAIQRLFGKRLSEVTAGQRYWGELVDEFGGERAQAMFIVEHETTHGITFDIAGEAISSVALDGEFENVEEAVYDALFGGDFAGILPDILEVYEDQATREMLLAISAQGLGGKMPLDYMREARIFATLHKAYTDGGEDAIRAALDDLAENGDIPYDDINEWVDMSDSLIMGTDKEATDFMRNWRVQQQAIAAELISELRSARRFGLVDAKDERVIKALRAVDVREAEIAANKSFDKLADEISETTPDARGFTSRRLNKIMSKAKDGVNPGESGWLKGKTAEEVAAAVVPDSEESLISLMSMSKFKTPNPTDKQRKHIVKAIKKEFGGLDNLNFDEKRIALTRKRLQETYERYPEFLRVAQQFGSPPFVLTEDFYATAVGHEAESVGGFYGHSSRSIAFNPGLTGTMRNGGFLYAMSALNDSQPYDDNGYSHGVLRWTERPFHAIAIHEYGHWLSDIVKHAGTNEQDMRVLLDAGLSEGMIKLLTQEHGPDGIFSSSYFDQLEKLHERIFGEKVKAKHKNAQEIWQKIKDEVGNFDSLKLYADSMDSPIALTNYALIGGGGEQWAEGFAAVITNHDYRLVNSRMKDAVHGVIDSYNDFEQSVLRGFNSRRDVTKPAKSSQIQSGRLRSWAEKSNLEDDEIGALLELEKASNFIQSGQSHAALAVLSAEATDGVDAGTLIRVADRAAEDGVLKPRNHERIDHLLRRISREPKGSPIAEKFAAAKEIADDFAPSERTGIDGSAILAAREIADSGNRQRRMFNELRSLANPENRRGFQSRRQLDSNNPIEETNLAAARTEEILKSAISKGIDIDAHERTMPTERDYTRTLQDLSPNVYSSSTHVQRPGYPTFDQIQNSVNGMIDEGRSELEILKAINPYISMNDPDGSIASRDSYRIDFAKRLFVAKAFAERKGDTARVEAINNFEQMMSSLTVDEKQELLREAITDSGQIFDQRPLFRVKDPLRIVDEGRYYTAHDIEEIERLGISTIGDVGGYDKSHVSDVRMNVEAQLLGMSGDRSDEYRRLRPASGYLATNGMGEQRASSLRSIYGEDVELQHSYPSLGSTAKEVESKGTKLSSDTLGVSPYGESVIILRPETADRTLAVAGDSLSDVGSSPIAARLSNLENSPHAAEFIDPMSLMYSHVTGDRSSVASTTLGSRAYRYNEAMVMGSFGTDDIAAIQTHVGNVRRGKFGTMNIPGTNSTAETNVTSLIAFAKERERMADKGIDLVMDQTKDGIFPVDEVEPFNQMMTIKFVERQIEGGKWRGVSVDDVIGNDQTTPYEAYLRYVSKTADSGMFLFDHDKNTGNSVKDAANLKSMVDEEIQRITGTSPSSTIRGMQSRRSTVREVTARSGFLPRTRSELNDHLFEKREALLQSLGDQEKAAVERVTTDFHAVVPKLTGNQSSDARSILSRLRSGKNSGMSDNLIDSYIPFNSVTERTELGMPYASQLSLRVPDTGQIDLAEGDVIDIPRHFRSEILSADSAIMDSEIGGSLTGGGPGKIILLTNDKDKGIPDLIGDDPAKHSTALTLPPSRLKVEHVGPDGTIFASIEQQNHVDAIDRLESALSMADSMAGEQEKTEIRKAIASINKFKKSRSIKRGLASRRQKFTSSKKGFPKYQEEAQVFDRASEVVSGSEVPEPSTRTQSIMKRIAEKRGAFAQPVSTQFIEEQEKKGGFLRGAQSISHEQKIKYHKETMGHLFNAIRAKREGREYFASDEYVFRDGRKVYESAGMQDVMESTLVKAGVEKQAEFNRLFEAIPEDVQQHIASRTNEELLEDLKRAAVEFNEGLDRRVRVRMRPGYLRGFSETGFYKTTHAEDVISEHSDPYARRGVEVQFGIAIDTPDELRPASGYVLHKDSIARFQKEARDKSEKDKLGTAVGEFFDYNTADDTSPFSSHVGIYGRAEVILKEDVSHRTGITGGDSLNGWHSPSLMNETDPERILMAIAAPRGKDGGNISPQNIALLQSMIRGDYSYASQINYAPNGSFNIYHEAVIAGSFDASEVAEIRVPEDDFAGSTREMRESVFGGQFIKDLDLSPEDSARIEKLLSSWIEKPQGSSLYDADSKEVLFIPSTVRQLAQILNHKQILENLRNNGFTGRLVMTNEHGVDLLDPDVYRGAQPGMTVEQVLRQRLAEDMRKAINEFLDKSKNKSNMVGAIDF